ncbi:porin family protein [Martelella alba]|uniref:Porin family protein n=1 Tax=Martelella alba TaxID=2590451 RepID=A0A506U9G5_9HYPH|nr:outer membrane protein [Martelella alba]TPW29731.1 porin family protein [Martelella alba]
MRIWTKTLLAAAASTAMGAGVASAADAVVNTQSYEPAPAMTYSAPKTNNWGGAYVGGALNYDWGTFNGGDFNASGFGGTLFGGYNLQDGSVVYGVEGDLSNSSQEQTIGAAHFEQGWNGSMRGRVGYSLDPVLIYGTAGVAATDTKAVDYSSSKSEGAWGYTVGAGAEAMITDNLSARLEYRYTDYGDQTYNLSSGSYKKGFEENTIKAGLAFHF